MNKLLVLGSIKVPPDYKHAHVIALLNELVSNWEEGVFYLSKKGEYEFEIAMTTDTDDIKRDIRTYLQGVAFGAEWEFDEYLE